MQIPVLVEPVANNGYRAKTGEPLPLCADGATPDEAVRNLQAAMSLHLRDGRQLSSVEVPAENPWLAMAGMYDPKDPFVQEWRQEMAAYRQEVENDPDRI